ncbi:chromosome segregation ATPase [Desulfacinum hydrothermale DSM 13146]|uniref:Chromosome segregation ATPase n=1 Tax=Desulfacinum hydrothermale DSM 13146 TaxID=1121390 RepID=A0A1W1XHY6_9BACT|nr:ParA family protein [Desulfacinum hydrothermale]SMC23579.1 chromosome segregation ATPase [Desulfacinum hydrothermale DSM 13146]
MAHILAIANQKGGVGKTTTAINLACALAQTGRRVLLVDCDPQGNASSGLGLRISEPDKTLHRVLLEENGAPPLHRPLDELSLWMIPANPSLAATEWKLTATPGSETVLASRLKPLDERFHFMILDCPPSLGLLTVNTLCAAHSVLIPLQCEYFAMEGLSLLLDTIRKIKLRWNPSLAIRGILLTMFDRRNNLSHQVATEIRKHLGARVFETLIPRNVRLSESPSHGLPVMLYDRHCAGSRAYAALAHEILQKGADRA